MTDRYHYLLNTRNMVVRHVMASDLLPLWELIQSSRAELWVWCEWVRDYSFMDCEAFVKAAQMAHQQAEPSALYYMVADRRHGQLMGVIALEGCDWQKRSAEVGLWLGSYYQGRGFATEVGESFCRVMQLEWPTLFWLHDEANVASDRLANRLGFYKLGKKKKQTVHMKSA